MNEGINKNTFFQKVLVTMATIGTGSHVSFFIKKAFFALKIRKLIIGGRNIDLIKNVCIDEMFSVA